MNTQLDSESVKGMDDVMEWAETQEKLGQNEYSPSAQEAARRHGFETWDYTERN